MATMPTIPGAAGGAVTGQKNIGIPVLGNRGGLNQFSPNGGNITGGAQGVSTMPGATAVTTGMAPASPIAPFPNQMANPLAHPIAAATPGTVPTPTGTPTPTAPVISPIDTSGAPVNNGNPAANADPQQQQQLQKQLVDIYGKGTGKALANLIGNLGSNDSSYLQAYKNAMAKTQAEGLSTIGTSLGNAGISADSSTAAIEKADYLSGIGSQVGLQEQQLIQSQQGLEANLIQGTQEDAKAEVGTSWLDTFGQVAGIVGNVAGDVIGMGGNPMAAASSLFGGSKAAPPMLPISGPSQLPGSYAPSMPSGIGYQPNLPGLDF